METRPEFFEVYIPEINSRKMLVNDGFLATLSGRKLPKRVMLRNQAKKGFWVEVCKEKDGVYFDGGWEVFVAENEIDVGYFLIFRYDGGSAFDVAIFDLSCCEKFENGDEEIEDCHNNVKKDENNKSVESSKEKEIIDDSDNIAVDCTGDKTFSDNPRTSRPKTEKKKSRITLKKGIKVKPCAKATARGSRRSASADKQIAR